LGFWARARFESSSREDASRHVARRSLTKTETLTGLGCIHESMVRNVSMCTRDVEVIGTAGASGGAGVCEIMVDEFMELVGSRADVDQLGEVLVRGCGCGCTYRERELVSRNPDCGAVRGLRDRRFVLGLLFARSLRPQLESEEWLRG
jgi:hypothetical protein